MDKKRVINAAITAGLSLSMIMTTVPATALAEGDRTDSAAAVEQTDVRSYIIYYVDLETNKTLKVVTIYSSNPVMKYSDLPQVPDGYKTVEVGDCMLEDGMKVYVKAATQDVRVSYVDEDSGDEIGYETVTVDSDAINFNSSELKNIPDGYELVEVGDIRIESGAATVNVRKVTGEDAQLQRYTIYYVDEETDKTVSSATFYSDSQIINYSDLPQVPDGYKTVEVGDCMLEDGMKVYVKAATQDVRVSYVDEDSGDEIGYETVTVDADEINVNSGQLTGVPEGYELVEVGDFLIVDGVATVEVKQVATTQDVVVSYIDQDSGEEVGTQNVTVDADDWKVNSSAMTDVPEGYELVEVGDFFIEDGKVTVYVKKTASEEPVETTYDVTFNYCLTNTENLVVTVKEGETVQAPTDPACPGYTFTGWYVDPERTQLYDFDSPVYEDMTLYAGWEEAADEGGETTTPDDTTPGDTTDETVTPVEPAATDETTESDELPKTGDTTNNAAVAGVGIASLIAAAASVILRRRNQQ